MTWAREAFSQQPIAVWGYRAVDDFSLLGSAAMDAGRSAWSRDSEYRSGRQLRVFLSHLPLHLQVDFLPAKALDQEAMDAEEERVVLYTNDSTNLFRFIHSRWTSAGIGAEGNPMDAEKQRVVLIPKGSTNFSYFKHSR